ncbi:hypothetical protein [Lignipirellula cremea]|uniref:Uncharacterized protein n=1 Tax=Lignipirellula cremea TaxID=2528010 RepID=A0A518DY31_9BACT|nr:hypothetical protein [Lignipirellula cremea]QDU96747.1 hypothetical protein Pla8534_45680 [Lignipirellula cremea]
MKYPVALLSCFSLLLCLASPSAADTVQIAFASGGAFAGQIDDRSTDSQLWLLNRSGGTLRVTSWRRDAIIAMTPLPLPPAASGTGPAADRARQLLQER